GESNCDNGTSGTHTSITVCAPARRYSGLRFLVGVPFGLNHRDPAVAVAPLNLGRMHWGWQGGYKFIRLEGRSPRGTAFRLHLGSTGCEGTIGDIRQCARPNRIAVDLSGFVPGRDAVVLQLGPLLRALEDGSSASCMSDADEPACLRAFAIAGLDPATG